MHNYNHIIHVLHSFDSPSKSKPVQASMLYVGKNIKQNVYTKVAPKVLGFEFT